MILKQSLLSLTYKNRFFLITISLLALVFSRFYNLNWGFPYLFHPDENNMTFAISQLSCTFDNSIFLENVKNCFNPNFYAYGQFPLYLGKLLAYLFQANNVQKYALSLRLISAICSVLSGIVLYKIVLKESTFKWAILSLLLYTFTPGLIQISHFGTTESIIILFILVLIYMKRDNLIISALVAGAGLATKTSFLPFSLIPMIFLNLNRSVFKYFILVALFTLLLSPHNIINYKDFLASFTYETGVATGKIPVFYTRQFAFTTPILFHISNIFLFSLGLPLLLLSAVSFIFLIVKKKVKYPLILLLLLPTAILPFVKWTRFTSHTYPVLILLSVLFLHSINKKYRLVTNLIFLILLLFQIIFGISFMTLYFKTDTRIVASNWLSKSIKSNSFVLSESANVVDIPIFSNSPVKQESIFLYDIDTDLQLSKHTFKLLKQADYIIVPSRRVFMNHTCYTSESGKIVRRENSICLKKERIYPMVTKYYQTIFGNNFKLIKTFSVFPSDSIINWLFQNGEQAEETWSVFDHPTVRIYKKVSPTKEI